MPSRPIRNADDLDGLFTLLGALLEKHKRLTVEWVEGIDRTAQQNKLMWKWASEAGDQIGETPDEVQRRWKLDHGIPILCVDSEEYRSFCRLTLGRLGREERLKAMEFTPVTSEMNVRQMVRFMDTVERECAEQGIELTQPEPELSAYHERYRDKPQRNAA
jgi:hypothetical protein